MLKKILIGVAVLVVALLGYAAMQPSTYHVERSASVAAPAQVVFEHLTDLRQWAAWSPWDKLDPSLTKTFGGPERGVGATYAWQGNDQVGQGKMTIVKEDPPRQITYKLEFIEPFESVAESTFTLAPKSQDETLVTWGMDGNNNFVGKLFGVFMDMDKMIGADFEKGLAQLETIAEADAKKRRAEEAVPQAAAEPAPQAAP